MSVCVATNEVSGDKCPCRQPCPLMSALKLIGGKWKIPILCVLFSEGTSRYNELKRKLSGITNTMLASSLKELEADGLVARRQYDEMPVKVEYSLTQVCSGLMPILRQLAEWGALIGQEGSEGEGEG